MSSNVGIRRLNAVKGSMRHQYILRSVSETFGTDARNGSSPYTAACSTDSRLQFVSAGLPHE